jgi:hypothetical protein
MTLPAQYAWLSKEDGPKMLAKRLSCSARLRSPAPKISNPASSDDALTRHDDAPAADLTSPRDVIGNRSKRR